MKNLKVIISIMALAALSTACRYGKRHVFISEGNHYNSLKIEYSGLAYFNNEGTGIARITPNGHVKYEKDGQEIIANSDANGIITYQVNGGDEQRTLNGNDKMFLARAVKDMIKHGHSNDGK